MDGRKGVERGHGNDVPSDPWLMPSAQNIETKRK